MAKKIWKWTKVSVFSFMAVVAMMGAVCAPSQEMMFLCVGLTVITGFLAMAEAILDGI